MKQPTHCPEGYSLWESEPRNTTAAHRMPLGGPAVGFLGKNMARNIKRRLLGERIEKERVRRIAKALGAEVVDKAPDAGGGTFGAARLAKKWGQRWARLRLDLERLERATMRLARAE